MSVQGQNGNITAEVISQETLAVSLSSEGTLKGSISLQKDLTATVVSQRSLQGAVSAQGNLKGTASKSSYTVDNALSDASENPVQNKVVTAALNSKAERINIARNTDIDKLFK
jgi:hypothetical protein